MAFGRYAQVADFGRRRPRLHRRRHRAERQDGARRADDPVVAGVDDVGQVAIDLRRDVLEHLALVAAAQRIGIDEALGEADDAELEAAGEAHLVAGAERDLDAAAADVDDHRRLGRVDAVDRGQVDEPGFFGAGDDARADAGLPLDRGQQLAAVLGLARRAGRGGEDLVHLVRSGEPLELRERLQGRRHRLAGQLLAVETAGAQPHHLLFAVDHLEGEVGPHPDHDHVDRVGADVDGGETHEVVAAAAAIMAPFVAPGSADAAQYGTTFPDRHAAGAAHRRAARAAAGGRWPATPSPCTRRASARDGCARCCRRCATCCRRMPPSAPVARCGG